MTEPRSSANRAEIHLQSRYHRIARTKGAATATNAGRTAYREEFQHDRGPDLDEPLDGTESRSDYVR